jgi:hypothetical protein
MEIAHETTIPPAATVDQGISLYGSGFSPARDETSEVDAFNMLIMRSTDWGRNPTDRSGVRRIAARPTIRRSL